MFQTYVANAPHSQEELSLKINSTRVQNWGIELEQRGMGISRDKGIVNRKNKHGYQEERRVRKRQTGWNCWNLCRKLCLMPGFFSQVVHHFSFCQKECFTNGSSKKQVGKNSPNVHWHLYRQRLLQKPLKDKFKAATKANIFITHDVTIGGCVHSRYLKVVGRLWGHLYVICLCIGDILFFAMLRYYCF